jgi:hypothetical protein
MFVEIVLAILQYKLKSEERCSVFVHFCTYLINFGLYLKSKISDWNNLGGLQPPQAPPQVRHCSTAWIVIQAVHGHKKKKRALK